MPAEDGGHGRVVNRRVRNRPGSLGPRQSEVRTEAWCSSSPHAGLTAMDLAEALIGTRKRFPCSPGLLSEHPRNLARIPRLIHDISLVFRLIHILLVSVSKLAYVNDTVWFYGKQADRNL
jgi:hypothetical protein